jgi:hypothetical protein
VIAILQGNSELFDDGPWFALAMQLARSAQWLCEVHKIGEMAPEDVPVQACKDIQLAFRAIFKPAPAETNEQLPWAKDAFDTILLSPMMKTPGGCMDAVTLALNANGSRVLQPCAAAFQTWWVVISVPPLAPVVYLHFLVRTIFL